MSYQHHQLLFRIWFVLALAFAIFLIVSGLNTRFRLPAKKRLTLSAIGVVLYISSGVYISLPLIKADQQQNKK